MDGVNAQSLNSGQQHGSQNDDGGAGVHDHAQDQEDDNTDGQNGGSGVEVAQDEVLHDLGGAGQRQHAAESGSESQNEGQTAVGLNGGAQHGDQVLVGDGLVDPQGDDDSIENGDTGSLGGSEEAGVDTAQDDDGAQQSPDRILEQLAEAVGAQLVHLGLDQSAVLTLADAVVNSVDHHEQTDHDTGHDAAQEQVTGGNAGGQRIQNEGDGRGNDNAQTAGDGDQTGRPALVVTQADHEGDTHGADGSGGSGAGTGDSTVEQAGQDNGTGNTAVETTDEV